MCLYIWRSYVWRIVADLYFENGVVLMKYITYLLLIVGTMLHFQVQAQTQTITCQVYGGSVFIWAGPTYPTGSMRVFL